MADKGVVIYYRAGVEDFDYDTGFVLATDYEALRKRCEAVEADAARYRRLRDDFTWMLTSDSDGTRLTVYMPGVMLAAIGPDVDEFDTAIDQAIAAAQEPSHG